MGAARDQFGNLVGQLVEGQVRANPVVSEVRKKWSAWRDPRARLIRARKRAVRATTAWGGITALSGAAAGVDFASVDPGFAAYAYAVFGAITGVTAVSAGIRTRRLYKTPLPEPAPVPYTLPAQGSAAREPMRRLVAAEQALGELLGELRAPTGAVPAVPEQSVDAAAAAARDTAEKLRATASRLVAVERTKRVASAAERASLDAPITELRRQLGDGVDEYTNLVAAAARAVAASATRPASTAVTEAADELTGLAMGLREISTHYLE